MRRTPRVVVVAPRIRTRFDGHEPVRTLVIGQAATRTREVGVERRRMLVILVEVAAGGVRLPDLHDRVAERPPTTVEHPAGDDDAFADRFAGVLAGEVMIELGDRSREERSRKIMEPAGQAHQWLRRRAQAGANVIGVEIRRLDRVFPVAHLDLASGRCNQYPTGNTCRCSRLLTKPHTPRGRNMATTTASSPSRTRYQAPSCARLCWMAKKMAVPTIGPSILPRPPISEMKIIFADHDTLKMELASTLSWLMMMSAPPAPQPAAETT